MGAINLLFRTMWIINMDTELFSGSHKDIERVCTRCCTAAAAADGAKTMWSAEVGNTENYRCTVVEGCLTSCLTDDVACACIGRQNCHVGGEKIKLLRLPVLLERSTFLPQTAGCSAANPAVNALLAVGRQQVRCTHTRIQRILVQQTHLHLAM